MSANDAIQVLRRHDPARGLAPVSPELRQSLREELLASAAPGTQNRRSRRRPLRALQLLAAAAAALLVGVGVAWATGALSPLDVFRYNPQHEGAAPGSLWDQQVVPSSVLEAATLEIPKVGPVGFWYARSEQGGWCGALQLPSGGWIGTGTDSNDAGGTLPGCFPTREAVNKSTPKAVYVLNGFDYQQGDIDAQSEGGSFWRISYGRITIPGAVRVTDLVSGRSTGVVHKRLFALAIPYANPMSSTPVHLVAHDADGRIIGDDCPHCQP